VRRILSPKQTRLWFPGNEEAVQYNLKLQELSDIQQEIMSQKGEDMKLSGMAQPSQALLDVNLLKEDAEEKVPYLASYDDDSLVDNVKFDSITALLYAEVRKMRQFMIDNYNYNG
jgi:hypothetical protein